MLSCGSRVGGGARGRRAYAGTQDCLTVARPNDEQGSVVPGSYSLEVLAGPDRRSVLTSEVVVGPG